MGLVIDTSALVAVERAGAGWEEALPPGRQDDDVALPAIVYAELLAGAYLADSPERAARRRARVDALAARVLLVDFGEAIAARWAELFARLTRSGERIPANDLAVAATALHLDAAVVVSSADEAHFSRVPGLEVLPIRG